MRVLVVPDQDNHLYLRCFKENLKKLDVVVYSSRFYVFSIFMNYFSTKMNILHIHWQSPYIVGRNLFFTILKSLIFLFELIFIKFLGVKVVWTVHNIVNHEKLFWRYEKVFNRFLYFLSDKVVVHLFSQKRELMDFYCVKGDNKIEVVFQGNYAHLSIDFDYKKVRSEIGLDFSRLVFLFFGQIRRYKGIEFIIESFKRAKRDDLLLYIVGKPYSNDYLKEIQSYCFNESKIKIISSHLDDYSFYTYLAASDCVLLTYKTIFNSAALITAMSFKKAVILSENTHFREVIGYDYPLFVKYGDKDALISIFENGNHNMFNEIGEKLYERVKKFSWLEHAQKVKSIYEEITK